jgi:hypothetical protein
MRMVSFVVVIAAACKGNPPPPSAGSAAPPPVAIAVDAAVAAGSGAKQFDVDCKPVAPASLHCAIAPGDGPMPAKTCFRGILAIDNFATHDADFVLSEQTCTTADVARGGSTQIDLALAKTDVAARCANAAACDANAVVATTDVDAAIKTWRARIHDALVQADADAKPSSDWDAVSARALKLCVDSKLHDYPGESRDYVQAQITNQSGADCASFDEKKLTAGVARCVTDAADEDALHDCEKPDPIVAAYVALHGNGN